MVGLSKDHAISMQQFLYGVHSSPSKANVPLILTWCDLVWIVWEGFYFIAGFALRLCNDDGTWNSNIDISNCESNSFTDLRDWAVSVK